MTRAPRLLWVQTMVRTMSRIDPLLRPLHLIGGLGGRRHVLPDLAIESRSAEEAGGRERSEGATELAFDVIVEIPRGQRNKYEYDHRSGRVRLNRTLFTSMLYPADYGFIEGTLGLDGDPLDALVLLDEPTFPGCVVCCRPIATYEMFDESGRDDKVMCVPDGDPRYSNRQDLSNLSPFLLGSIQHFLESYKDLEPASFTSKGSWMGRKRAEEVVAASFERARSSSEVAPN
jgi:inorganic pyrophosphatase